MCNSNRPGFRVDEISRLFLTTFGFATLMLIGMRLFSWRDMFFLIIILGILVSLLRLNVTTEILRDEMKEISLAMQEMTENNNDEAIEDNSLNDPDFEPDMEADDEYEEEGDDEDDDDSFIDDDNVENNVPAAHV